MVLTVEIWDIRLGPYVVNAVLLKVRPPKLSVQAQLQYAIQFNQDTTHLALNATQGHKRRLLIQPLSNSKCHTRTQA